MDPIVMEPLSSALPTSIVPYDTSEDEVLAAYALDPKENSLIGSQDAISPNLGNNRVQTLLETLVPEIKIEAKSSKESPVEKHYSQGPNPIDSVVQTTSETTPGIGGERQPIQLQWVAWVKQDSRVEILKY